MPDLMRKHLESRLRCALWAEVEQHPARMAVLAEATIKALAAVMAEAERRGMTAETPRDLPVTGETAPRTHQCSPEACAGCRRGAEGGGGK